MRVIETKVYTFAELSEVAQQVAIGKVRESYYMNNDFGNWAIDDCSLFEPQGLEDLLGEEYKFPLIKNLRHHIYYSIDREWYLDCEDAMIVTNDAHFYKWLGIPPDIYESAGFGYRIFTPRTRNASTTIVFHGYDSQHEDVLDDAREIFEDHVTAVLRRIEGDIEYRGSDESIADDIEANEYEFTEDGNIF
jgi:hypothetical protein